MAQPPRPKRPRKSMREYGFRTLSVYLPERLYQAMRRYCFERETKHAELMRRLLEDELRKAGHLK